MICDGKAMSMEASEMDSDNGSVNGGDVARWWLALTHETIADTYFGTIPSTVQE